MKLFWAAWPSLRRKIFSKRKKLLLLDFDGTLAPLAKTPDSVSLNVNVRKTLADLAKQKDWNVAVTSGRSLKDMRRYLSNKNLIYVGNHGLEIKGKGLRLPPTARKARRCTHAMDILAQKLKAAFYFWPGVLVENKIYTLSLHFRNLRPDRKLAFNELITFYKEKFRGFPIVWKKGKKVWEIRPVPGWGKGKMALYLAKKFPGALTVAIGDDKTDEDMFQALRLKGITVRVGYSGKSLAQYYLKSQPAVIILLKNLTANPPGGKK